MTRKRHPWLAMFLYPLIGPLIGVSAFFLINVPRGTERLLERPEYLGGAAIVVAIFAYVFGLGPALATGILMRIVSRWIASWPAFAAVSTLAGAVIAIGFGELLFSTSGAQNRESLDLMLKTFGGAGCLAGLICGLLAYPLLGPRHVVDQRELDVG